MVFSRQMPRSGVDVSNSSLREFPWWLSSKNPTSVHEEAGSIPGLAQGGKDPALP